MPLTFAPIVIPLPILAAINSTLISFPIPGRVSRMELLSLSLMVQTIVSGTFTVECRRLVAGTLLDTISVTAAGPGGLTVHDQLQHVFDLANAGLRLDVTSIGTGVVGAFITAWFGIDSQGD